MKAVLTSMLFVAAFALASVSHAASRSASMQVSFTIVESCTVEATSREQSVQCTFATPYAISKPAPQAAQPQSRAESSADDKIVTITF